jgi:hypothetical protein
MDRDVVNLAVLALHEQRVAIPTDKIDGVIAGVENRGHLENAIDEWWGDEFEAETSVGAHGVLPCVYRREPYSVSQSPTLGAGPPPVMALC